MANTVTISGMFGNDKTYFSDSPVVIDINGLYWGETVTSPFTIVRVEVIYEGSTVGDFRADTGGQTSISFDISPALRAIWSDYPFDDEVAVVQSMNASIVRQFREYSLIVYTEYIDQDGTFTVSNSGIIAGGRCMLGGLTEWERSLIRNKGDADASYWELSNLRNGDASTKPTSTPERVGMESPTSWVDVQNSGTMSVFFPFTSLQEEDKASAHPPIVLRDMQPYVDFLFVNRRGALETCSALMLESMDINVDVEQYARVERPSFQPSRSLMAFSKGGRRSWAMSSGAQTREWAEWWVLEFLMSRRWWMRYPIRKATGVFVPVIVEPSKKDVSIYNRSKQQMPSVDFTVTLALEG